jgi:hypothetical protein
LRRGDRIDEVQEVEEVNPVAGPGGKVLIGSDGEVGSRGVVLSAL